MKNITVYGLAFIAIAVMLLAGVNGISRDHSYGPFFIFIGICSAAGLSLDITRVIKERIKRGNVRKLGR